MHFSLFGSRTLRMGPIELTRLVQRRVRRASMGLVAEAKDKSVAPERQGSGRHPQRRPGEVPRGSSGGGGGAEGRRGEGCAPRDPGAEILASLRPSSTAGGSQDGRRRAPHPCLASRGRARVPGASPTAPHPPRRGGPARRRTVRPVIPEPPRARGHATRPTRLPPKRTSAPGPPSPTRDAAPPRPPPGRRPSAPDPGLRPSRTRGRRCCRRRRVARATNPGAAEPQAGARRHARPPGRGEEGAGGGGDTNPPSTATGLPLGLLSEV